ncbi:outer membrane protein [Verminephrobacter eiseniae EF01-2]|uniref:Outer membrane protein n=1 Tax=Verminephrobacter eiseniae (strain EF01-2) TaxID=391735 RepID=A1WJH7_VEREI|nr:outer membrane protein [Verminephrobacter eiseniae EF01-2]MCW5283395.1 hypothetical protein [Verminephrobacter eiseniae]MCW5301104.1 hypothetical protein [Verminephrobacter eiseniae]MCW8180827.1 hypothetical protein [Verminephrobacter eiseniae]MCW8191092.1 hypothetical protein [Verminephrobacter eiseniae]
MPASTTTDTTAPSVTIEIDKERLTAGETATVTITFSEIVTGFNTSATSGSVILADANGTLSNLTQDATDGRIWRATFTPTVNLSNTRSQLRLKLDGITDSRGNAASGLSAARSYIVDTAAFVINKATVEDKQLILRYSDETTLDPDQAHNAPNDAFVVMVDGVRNDVAGVAVDAAAKTITLTLVNAVRGGQRVTVAYNDPSTGNDQQAVQEAGTGSTSGKDAASFAAMPVVNLLGEPPPEPPPETESSSKGATTNTSDSGRNSGASNTSDFDSDGLSNAQEDLAPGLLRSDGSAGMAGDGNGDGIKDSQQIAVASTRDQTLVAGSQDGKLIPGSNARITELVRSDAPTKLPKGMEMPLGLTSFKVSLAEGRSTESFSLYVDSALGANGYWVKNSAGTWVNLASEPYGGKVSSEGGRTRLDFQIQDGGQYDADGQVNGSISAPGAVAKMPLSIIGQTAPQGDSLWF